MTKIRLNINGREVIGHKGQTLLEVAKDNGITIPTLCHDERVESYGACGLCVVEIEGSPKLLRACATEASSDMIIFTDSPKVRNSRKMALELLFSDHIGDCRPPCMLACPANTDCQGYVGLIANGQYREALELIKEQLPLPASIGRVCPHPCEDACRRQLVDEPISIAWLKSFVADMDLNDENLFIPGKKPMTDKRVAIIGGGPSGLTAAYYLAREGHTVVIYDAMPEMGGMLKYGIPQYRLPKEILNKEIAIIEKMGVKMLNNIKVGRDIKLDHIRDTFDAVYISIGAWESSKLNCPGEDLDGVIGGIEFLTRFATNHPIRTGDRIAVVGGGNTAMDVCRTAIRLGAKEVYALYRRTKVEMPAEEVEVIEGEEEGIIFKFLVSPIEVIGENGRVSKIRLQKMKLGEEDNRGRRRPIPIEGEEEIIEVDSIISSIGQEVDGQGFEGLEKTSWGTIHADEETFITNLKGVFAGGDAINNGPGIAIEAIAQGKKASVMICKYLKGENINHKKPFYVTRDDITKEDFLDIDRAYRPHMPHLSPEIRRENFEEIVAGYTKEDARTDANRCLECGCHDVFQCRLLHYGNEYGVNPQRLAGKVNKSKEKDKHPFILRNSDKCILCGLCSRVCEEIMGIAAIGISHRGFDALVEPAFHLPLRESNCISCGQCISVCPTGALQENLNIVKPVPLDTKVTHTICSHCSIGCNIDLHTKGNMMVKSLPNRESKVDDGLLCVKGRFGFDSFNHEGRILQPMIRKESKLVEVSWEEALLYTAKKAQSLKLLYGPKSLGLSISDRYTNEEIYLLSKFAREVLETDNITSFNDVEEGIEKVLGYDASTNTLEELISTETIILIGSDIMQDHTIVGLKIRKAIDKGAKLIVINPFDSQIDNWAYDKITPSNDLVFLKEILKTLINKGILIDKEKILGFEELKSDLDSILVSKEAEKIANIYYNSKKAMIVYDEKRLTPDASKLLANMAVIAGHIGKARTGIIQLKSNSNSQGLRDMGIKKIVSSMVRGINSKNIRGLLVFGEDIPNINLSTLDFLMVQDTHLTETAKKAHVVIPATAFAESSGTFTSTERRIQKLNKVIEPILEYENWQVFVKLANTLSQRMDYSSPEEIFEEITRTREEYFKADKYIKEGVFWPVDKSPILYTNGFNFSDKKARLEVVKEGQLFNEKINTNNLNKVFIKLLKEEEMI